jgi:uncharacterized membrane protein YhaH (DUF805 family)
MGGAEPGFGHWLWRPWRLTFDYAGRSPRREYWLLVAQFYVILIGLGIMIGLTSERIDAKKDGPWGVLFTAGVVTVLLLLLPLLSAAVRRVHDHDKSGWMVLLALVPAVGWIFYLILMLTPGSEGENHYGPDPRDPHLSQNEVSDIFS